MAETVEAQNSEDLLPPCIILAGGLGTRMWPHTEKLPKALLPINGIPFVHYQLVELARQGLKEICFCIGYQGEQIRNFVGDGQRWNLNVRYVDEGKVLLGTGGALRLACEKTISTATFFVMYGDSFLQVPYGKVYRKFQTLGCPMLMTVLENSEKWDHSNCSFDGTYVTHYEKNLAQKPAAMKFIDYGLSVINRDLILKEFTEGVRCDLSILAEKLSRNKELGGFEVFQRFYEIGSKEGYADFEDFIRSAALPLN